MGRPPGLSLAGIHIKKPMTQHLKKWPTLTLARSDERWCDGDRVSTNPTLGINDRVDDEGVTCINWLRGGWISTGEDSLEIPIILVSLHSLPFSLNYGPYRVMPR